jgi:hypothetical protein
LALINYSFSYLIYKVKTDGITAFYFTALLTKSIITITLLLILKANAVTKNICANLTKVITLKSAVLKERDN